MKYRFILILFVFFSHEIWAQTFQKINVNAEKVKEGVYDFYAVNPNVMPIQLMFYFTELDNMSTNVELPYCTTLYQGKTNILSLHRDNIDIPGGFNYKYATRTGAYPVVPDPNQTYQLPVDRADTVRCTLYDYGSTRTPDKVVLGFEFLNSDTVMACRDGVVGLTTKTRIKDSITYGINSVTLVHSDYTMGKYEGFKDGEVFVAIGDSVKKGDVVGVAETSKGTTALMRFSVYYSNLPIDTIVNQKLREYYSYIQPKFEIDGLPIELSNGINYSR